MFESKYSKVLTVILVIVIIAIVLLIGFFAYDLIKKYNLTKQASDFVESYQGEITAEGEDNSDQSDEDVEINKIETEIETSGSTSGKRKYKGFTVVGTMKIPAINLEYPIFEEVSTSALENGLIALYPNGDNVNLPGNTVIIGHNYRNGTLFSNVKKLTKGAKIYITDFRGKSITYEVYNIFEANQNDTSFYSRDTSGVAEITLSTCTDSSNDQRTIVFAKQI